MAAVAVAAVVVLVPLTAWASAESWWFLRSDAAPRPVSEPGVVREGTWDGVSWQLVAYPSTTDGLCFGITESGTDNGSLACTPFVGVARQAATKESPDMRITALMADGRSLPAHIAGPVVESATEVVIEFPDGERLSFPTFAAPEPLSRVRFYASPLPSGRPPLLPDQTDRNTPSWVAGVDASGRVVACLAPRTATNGISPLKDCPV